MDECPHGDDPLTCPPCRRAAGKDAKPKASVEFTFQARYPGHCPGCHLPIHEGQECAKMDDGRTLHLDCTRS